MSSADRARFAITRSASWAHWRAPWNGQRANSGHRLPEHPWLSVVRPGSCPSAWCKSVSPGGPLEALAQYLAPPWKATLEGRLPPYTEAVAVLHSTALHGNSIMDSNDCVLKAQAVLGPPRFAATPRPIGSTRNSWGGSYDRVRARPCPSTKVRGCAHALRPAKRATLPDIGAYPHSRTSCLQHGVT